MLWYVMLGSAVGGGARFLLGTFVQTRTGAAFPVGTLVINITGSFVLAFIFRYAAGTSISPEVRAMLTTGLCGGYTTFSTFSWEAVRLIEDGDYARASWYIGLSVALSLAGAFIGIGLARELLDLRRRL
jgi:CrcB protein